MQEYIEMRKFVSRERAKIVIIASKIAIEDLGNPNGIFVNNVRVKTKEKKFQKMDIKYL
jgi:pSer/pThr/pTyr-binding forkhead associated (FHA) protein